MTKDECYPLLSTPSRLAVCRFNPIEVAPNQPPGVSPRFLGGLETLNRGLTPGG